MNLYLDDDTKAWRRTLFQQTDESGLLEGVTIVLEPGRRIVGDTGLVLTRVCNIKRRPETGDTWLLTDAGYSLMLSQAMYKWYYHLISASRADEDHATPYKVAGPLCDSGDVYFDIEQGARQNQGRIPAEVRGAARKPPRGRCGPGAPRCPPATGPGSAS